MAATTKVGDGQSLRMPILKIRAARNERLD
jgi:hypothetical protein